eukprot:NODE_6357_length_894_cov_51.678340_g5765_i0.p1 GENE.NODE_6357_length_894_cov_51.678340_g5765_i0~~NODE_6357_length_894_cov_51.678340_g5765_i0.p1  ORF type:complete len:245 (-),score=42.95 NODE_6357_length_894_cov_51.678340_g5765_i0:106-840(-)
MSSSFTIYGDPLSQCVRRVLILLEILKIDYNLVLVDLLKKENTSKEFLSLTNIQKVPVLVQESEDGKFTLFESNAMLRYISNIAKSDYYPFTSCPKTTALCDQWLDWTQSTLRPIGVSPYVRNTYLYPLLGSPVDENALKTARDNIYAAVDVLDKWISSHSNWEYLTGTKPTIADLSVQLELSQLDLSGLDLTKYSSVCRWYHRVKQIPHYNDAKIWERYHVVHQQVKEKGYRLIDFNSFGDCE